MYAHLHRPKERPHVGTVQAVCAVVARQALLLLLPVHLPPQAGAARAGALHAPAARAEGRVHVLWGNGVKQGGEGSEGAARPGGQRGETSAELRASVTSTHAHTHARTHTTRTTRMHARIHACTCLVVGVVLADLGHRAPRKAVGRQQVAHLRARTGTQVSSACGTKAVQRRLHAPAHPPPCRE